LSHKFEKEIERFVSDYYKDHDEAIGKLDKWANETEKGLRQLDTQAGKFERELETKFEKLDKWLAKRQAELDKQLDK
jgi:flagellar capping protein FliD